MKGPLGPWYLVCLPKDTDFLVTGLGLNYLKLFPLQATYQLLNMGTLAVPDAQSWPLFLFWSLTLAKLIHFQICKYCFMPVAS